MAYRAWLRARQPSLPTLNTRWGTAFATWEEVAPPALRSGDFMGMDFSSRWAPCVCVLRCVLRWTPNRCRCNSVTGTSWAWTSAQGGCRACVCVKVCIKMEASSL